jgi:hypothetical protein
MDKVYKHIDFVFYTPSSKFFTFYYMPVLFIGIGIGILMLK